MLILFFYSIFRFIWNYYESSFYSRVSRAREYYTNHLTQKSKSNLVYMAWNSRHIYLIRSTRFQLACPLILMWKEKWFRLSSSWNWSKCFAETADGRSPERWISFRQGCRFFWPSTPWNESRSVVIIIHTHGPVIIFTK